MRPPAPCSSSRCVLAAFQPWFSPPTRLNAGTRTWSKNTVFFCTGSVPPSPPVPISSMGCTVMPGRSASIMNHDRFSWRAPPGFVHAIIQMRSVPWSLPTKIFWPLMTYSSPSRMAAVVTPARSEPAPGSVSNCHVRTSPRKIGGRNACF